MTNESIESEEEFNKPLNEMLKNMVKERLEKMMKKEREAFLAEEEPEDVANGYYNRDWETRFGEIEDLKVPRDREGDFNTKLFSPYQRRSGWLENLVIKMYSRGLSTRKIADLLEEMYGTHYSPTTVSRITDQAIEDVKEWRNRPLAERYSVIFLDGMSFKLRRGSVANEVIYFAAGIDQEGYREMLGFWFGAEESSTVWKEILEELKERGVEQVLLIATDDLPGIKEAVAQSFPKADHQQCVLHKVRNTTAKVRGTDEDELTDDLKKIYEAPDKEMAKNAFSNFKDKWKDAYPDVVESWEDDLPDLLTFMDYPYSIRKSIYTTNWLERTIKEFRRREKTMDSLPNPKAAKKLFYLLSKEQSEDWTKRRMRGFKKARDQLEEMFEERYGTNRTQPDQSAGEETSKIGNTQ